MPMISPPLMNCLTLPKSLPYIKRRQNSNHRQEMGSLFRNGFGVGALVAGLTAQAAVFTFDPDAPGLNDGDNISAYFSGVAFSSTGGGDGSVYASPHGMAPTGSRVFAWNNGGFLDEHWGRSNAPAFEAIFTGFLANQVSIDYLSDLGQVGLEAYDTADNLLGAVVGGPDWSPQTLTFSTGGPDLIKRVRVTVAFAPGADFGMLDNLVVYSAIPEPEQTALLVALGLTGLALWRRCARCG